MTPRTSAGYLKFRPVRPGARVALVAPASSFDRAEFDLGVVELRRLGFDPVYDDDVFEKSLFTAGRPHVRAHALLRAFDRDDVDAVIAVRGGYGSAELLPLLDAERIRRTRTAFVGYSDVTSIHSWLGAAAGLASIHGAMIEGRLARGEAHYDARTLLASFSAEPVGEIAAAGLETITPGAAGGPLVGGTLTNLIASFETPYAFRPPAGHVLLLDEVGERPYRLHRMLTQWRLSGRFAAATAVVFGQMPRCDEPGGRITARDVVRDVLQGFPGPVLFGLPSGHTTTPSLSLPLGVHARVIADRDAPRFVIDEAAAA